MLKAGFPDAAVIRTHQDVHDEHPPEAAPAPHHCGERFLRLNGVIFLLYLPGAYVASAAIGLLEIFPEIRQQRLAAALVAFRILQHGVGVLFRNTPLLFVLRLTREIEQLRHIRRAVKQQTVRGIAITSGPARFLIIALHVFRQIKVCHKAHVGLVDAHAESHRSHHDGAFVPPEGLLHAHTLRIGQACMVGFGLHAFFLKECGGLFDFSARGPVDDPRLPLMAAEKRKQLGMRFLFGQDMIEQVRAVERSPDQPGLPQAEPGKDVSLHLGRGRSRERRHRALGEPLDKPGKRQIIRAEIMSPLGNAVRLVDGEERDGP